MIKKLFAVSAVLFLLTLYPGAARSATPFEAPAEFDLAGSTFGLSITFSFPIGDRTLELEPTDITGKVKVDAINRTTGYFTGRFENIAGSRTTSIAVLGDLVFTLTLNSTNLTGWFVWAQDRVILYPETITATLDFGGGSGGYSVPLNGVPLQAQYNNGTLSIISNPNFSNSYEGYSFTADIDINLQGTLQEQSESDPWSDLSLDRTAYGAGDSMQLLLSLWTGSGQETVNLYLGLLAPDGTAYFYPGWATAPTAILSNVGLPANTPLPATEVLNVTLPDGLPIAADPAPYNFFFAMVDTATGDFVGGYATAPFTYAAAPAAPEGYDGTWDGTADNMTNSDVCSSFAEVHFEIANGRISGYAADAEDEYPTSGVVDANGKIVDGVIYEELAGQNVQIGAYQGEFSENTGTGTWHDMYGCQGTFNVTRTPADR